MICAPREPGVWWCGGEARKLASSRVQVGARLEFGEAAGLFEPGAAVGGALFGE